MPTPIRILLVDDHTEIRRGIRQLLLQSPNFEIVGEAADGSKAVKMVAELSPHVVIMDIQMPIMDGIEATRIITAIPDGPKVIALSASNQEHAYAMLNAGAADFIAKERAYLQLAPAIDRLFEMQANRTTVA